MILSDLVAGAILKATGEVSTAAVGDSEWNKILGIANFYIANWANEPGVGWNSLYLPELSFGTVTNSSSFALPTAAVKISDMAGDSVRIDHSNGVSYTLYQIVNANELKRYYSGNKASSYGNVVAQVGKNLIFNHTFVSTDPQFGGDIKVPVYSSPALLSGATDVIPVDDPNWLVLVCAAEYVRNDITLQQQYPNLIAEANQVMTDMKTNNDTAEFSQIYREPVGDGVHW